MNIARLGSNEEIKFKSVLIIENNKYCSVEIIGDYEDEDVEHELFFGEIIEKPTRMTLYIKLNYLEPV